MVLRPQRSALPRWRVTLRLSRAQISSSGSSKSRGTSRSNWRAIARADSRPGFAPRIDRGRAKDGRRTGCAEPALGGLPGRLGARNITTRERMPASLGARIEALSLSGERIAARLADLEARATALAAAVEEGIPPTQSTGAASSEPDDLAPEPAPQAEPEPTTHCGAEPMEPEPEPMMGDGVELEPGTIVFASIGGTIIRGEVVRVLGTTAQIQFDGPNGRKKWLERGILQLSPSGTDTTPEEDDAAAWMRRQSSLKNATWQQAFGSAAEATAARSRATSLLSASSEECATAQDEADAAECQAAEDKERADATAAQLAQIVQEYGEKGPDGLWKRGVFGGQKGPDGVWMQGSFGELPRGLSEEDLGDVILARDLSCGFKEQQERQQRARALSQSRPAWQSPSKAQLDAQAEQQEVAETAVSRAAAVAEAAVPAATLCATPAATLAAAKPAAATPAAGRGSARWDFAPTGPKHVALKQGDIVHVLERIDDHWLMVQNGAESGLVPAAYVICWGRVAVDPAPAPAALNHSLRGGAVDLTGETVHSGSNGRCRQLHDILWNASPTYKHMTKVVAQRNGKPIEILAMDRDDPSFFAGAYCTCDGTIICVRIQDWTDSEVGGSIAFEMTNAYQSPVFEATALELYAMLELNPEGAAEDPAEQYAHRTEFTEKFGCRLHVRIIREAMANSDQVTDEWAIYGTDESKSAAKMVRNMQEGIARGHDGYVSHFDFYKADFKRRFMDGCSTKSEYLALRQNGEASITSAAGEEWMQCVVGACEHRLGCDPRCMSGCIQRSKGEAKCRTCVRAAKKQHSVHARQLRKCRREFTAGTIVAVTIGRVAEAEAEPEPEPEPEPELESEPELEPESEPGLDSSTLPARSDLHRLVGEVSMSADMDHTVRLRLADGFVTPFFLVTDLEDTTRAECTEFINQLQTGDAQHPDWLNGLTAENVVRPHSAPASLTPEVLNMFGGIMRAPAGWSSHETPE